jgi:hypothetical protein
LNWSVYEEATARQASAAAYQRDLALKTLGIAAGRSCRGVTEYIIEKLRSEFARSTHDVASLGGWSHVRYLGEIVYMLMIAAVDP